MFFLRAQEARPMQRELRKPLKQMLLKRKASIACPGALGPGPYAYFDGFAMQIGTQ